MKGENKKNQTHPCCLLWSILERQMEAVGSFLNCRLRVGRGENKVGGNPIVVDFISANGIENGIW